MEYTSADLLRERNEETIRETMDGMRLGERYDEYYGFDCDNYDPYDPFGGEDGEDLFRQIEEEFGADAEEIIARIICGESVDAAIQSVL